MLSETIPTPQIACANFLNDCLETLRHFDGGILMQTGCDDHKFISAHARGVVVFTAAALERFGE